MDETAKEVTAEYAKQIITAARTKNDEEATYLVTELLKEYGAKAYNQGRQRLAEQVAKLV